MAELKITLTDTQIARIKPMLENRYGKKSIAELGHQFVVDELKREVLAYERAVAQQALNSGLKDF